MQCVKKTRDYADANVFTRPFEIYRAALYNVYGGSRMTDVPYIYKHNIWIASVCIVCVGLAPIIITSDMQGLFGASLS